MDIFTMSIDGGKATRVTTHSGTETPLAFSPDDKYIYFSAAIQDPASSAMWSASWLTELYRVKAILRPHRQREHLAQAPHILSGPQHFLL